MSRISRLPIPNNNEWDDKRLLVVCVPNFSWQVAVKNALNYIGRGRTWDEDTGSILQAQKTAKEILSTMSSICLQEILNELKNTQKINLMLVAAITGERINLDAPLPTGIIDYDGISPQLRTTESSPRRIADVVAQAGTKQHEDLITVNDAIAKLETALNTINTTISKIEPEDLEDDLSRIWQLIEVATTLLGGTGVIPPIIPPL